MRFSLVGKVGQVGPPPIVLPLTVEPTKPRLCHDARYLNLWMLEKPFSLNKVTDLHRYVFKDSYQTVLGDKSGYDHLCARILVSSGGGWFLPIIYFHLVGKFHLMYITRLALWRQIFYAP